MYYPSKAYLWTIWVKVSSLYVPLLKIAVQILHVLKLYLWQIIKAVQMCNVEKIFDKFTDF